MISSLTDTRVDDPTYSVPTPQPVGERRAKPREFLMCPPAHFEVAYAINAWMQLDVPVDRDRATGQWQRLVSLYRQLGHVVHEATPEPGLPDMVFAANCALMVDGMVLGARFRHPERAGEAPAFRRWFETQAVVDFQQSGAFNEGEGDFTVVGERILAGTGYRTDHAAHAEAQEFFGRPVISLTLADPSYYHLDVALFALDEDNIAYYPGAFSPGSRRTLERLYPDAIIAAREDAETFGLNSVSDGRNVIIDERSTQLIGQLRARGFVPVTVDLSELAKAGGGAKCCTQELRRVVS